MHKEEAEGYFIEEEFILEDGEELDLLSIGQSLTAFDVESKDIINLNARAQKRESSTMLNLTRRKNYS
ncbi:hypothetical protein Peur_011318 [Populus x canadensis]